VSSRIKQAVAYIRQGDGVAARLELLTLLKEDPKNADGWVLLAHLTNDRERKIAWLEKAIALEPDHVQALKQLSKVRTQSPNNREPVSNSLPPARAESEQEMESPSESQASNSTLLIDDLVERWLRALSYTEFYVIKLLYGLEGETFSAESAKRIIGSTIRFSSIEDVQRAALSKLRESEPSALISPLRMLMNVVVREKGSAQDLDRVLPDIRRSVDTTKYELAGVMKLLLDVEPESILSQKLTGDLVSVSSTAKVSEPPAEYVNAEPRNSLASVHHKPIDVLGLPTRIYNSLRRSGINTVGEVLELYPDNFTSVRNLGSLSEATLLAIIDSFLSPEQRAALQVSTRVYRAPAAELELRDSGQTEQREPDSFLPPSDTGKRHQELQVLSIGQAVASALADIYKDTYEGLSRASIESYLQYYFSRTRGSVMELRLTRRTATALKRARINTIGQLVALSTDELREVRGIGDQAFQEINASLRRDLLRRGHSQLRQPKKPISIVWAPEGVRLTDDLLGQISIYRLGLTRKSEELLENARVRTLSDLIQQSDMLVRDPYIKVALARYTSWLSDARPEDIEREIGGAGLSPLHRLILQSKTVEELVGLWLSALAAREQRVIRTRYGLDAEAATLEDIGSEIGVTRERIRQIQKKALRRLGSPENRRHIQPLLSYLEIELALRDGVMLAEDASQQGQCGVKLIIGRISLTGLAMLIADLDAGIDYSRGQKLITDGKNRHDLVTSVQKCFIGVLGKSMRPMTVDMLLEEAKQTAAYESTLHRLSNDFLRTCLQASPDLIEREPNLFGLLKWENRITDEIVMALDQLGTPSHYSAITEKVNDLLPRDRQTDKRNVHAHLGRYTDIFVRVGHGIFGLVAWGLPDDGNLANAAVRVIIEAGHPLHIDILTQRVLETWQVQPGSVNMAVQNDERFVRTGQGVYFLRELLGERTKVKRPSFSEMFGDKLAQLDDARVHGTSVTEANTHAEVDKLREIGLDFFGRKQGD
jgi:hypothetical protein